MKKTKLLLIAIAIIASYSVSAQVAITTDGSSAHASAMLEVNSTDKGFLPPRMTTTEIGNIVSPANGLFVFNTTDNKAYIFVSAGNQWKEVNYGAGTISGPFTCGDAFIDDRDSKSYTTVLIGTQCWMAENLNIGTKIDGSGEQTDNATIEKYCYSDNTSTCDTYGGLYQWNEMMQYVTTAGTQGICPTGWHLPSDAEWKTMEMFLGMSQAQADAAGWRGTGEGKKMKSINRWINDGNGTNTSGFTAFPGGSRGPTGSFVSLGSYGRWWSSTEDSGVAGRRELYRGYDKVLRNNLDKAYGFSVRCIKD